MSILEWITAEVGTLQHFKILKLILETTTHIFVPSQKIDLIMGVTLVDLIVLVLIDLVWCPLLEVGRGLVRLDY